MNEILNKAITFHKSGKLKRAQKIYKNILNKNPSNFEALSLLGSLNLQLKKYSEAEEYITRAININPKYFGSYINLGSVYLNKEKYSYAINNFKRAIELNPISAESYNNLAIAQKKNYLFDEALLNYQRAINLKPNYSEAHNNLGLLYQEFGKLKEAIDKYNDAIKLNPKYIDAIKNRAQTYFSLNYFHLAVEDYNKLKLLDKNNYLIYCFEIYLIEAQTCDYKNYKKFLFKLKNQIFNDKYICEPGILLLHCDSLKLIKYNLDAFYKKEFKSINTVNIINKKNNNKKIKIAYYSSDFRQHPVGNLLLNILENHDQNKFEVINFYFQKYKDDEITKKIEKLSKEFIYAGRSSDEIIFSTSLSLKIDIAIDLMGHTKNNRTRIFAKRLAPVQINFLGYPGSVGKYIDYIIADKNLIPESNKKFYSEKVIYLENFILPPINLLKNNLNHNSQKDPNVSGSKFIYCCFNNNYKINEKIFHCWMEILKETPNSLLFLLEKNEESKNNLIIEAKKKGIKSDKIVFFSKVSYLNRFEKYKFVDVFLDTFPYGSHTTALETISCFVPIITMEGNSFQSRVCSSLLKNLNLSELVAKNLEDYKKIAINFYKMPNKLKEIKEKLHYELNNNPIFNKKIYTQNLENIYLRTYDNM